MTHHTRRTFLTRGAALSGGLALAGLSAAESGESAELRPAAAQPAPTQGNGRNSGAAPEDRPQPDRDRLNVPVIVAMLQMRADGSNQPANLNKADDYCRRAARMGADIALMPEMWNIGYTGFESTDPAIRSQWQAQAVRRDSPWVRHFTELAAELNMAIGLTYLEQWPGAPRNSLTLIDRHGRETFTYAKMHTCDFAAFEAATTPGDEFYVVDLDTVSGPVKVGAMICFDREFPEAGRLLMLKGAELVITPNACLLDDIRLAQYGTRALENSFALAMANYPDPGFGGRSCAYMVDGSRVALAGNDEQILLATFEMGWIRPYRERSIWGNAFRRPHRYGALTDTEVKPPFVRENAFGEPFVAEQR